LAAIPGCQVSIPVKPSQSLPEPFFSVGRLQLSRGDYPLWIAEPFLAFQESRCIGGSQQLDRMGQDEGVKLGLPLAVCQVRIIAGNLAGKRQHQALRPQPLACLNPVVLTRQVLHAVPESTLLTDPEERPVAIAWRQGFDASTDSLDATDAALG